jgi:hypothetical protein
VAFGGEEPMMGKEKKGRSKRVTNNPKGIARRLFFRETCLGELTNVEGDFPWMFGKLTPTSAAVPFWNFFRWMVDEENVSKEPPFEEALLDEDNWFIEDESGKKVSISMPAVHEDGLIAWRCR